MRGLFSEASRFLWAFVSHWQSYATGGVVTAVITLIERVREKTLSKRTYVLVFVVAFSLASFFMAWREQFERAENAEARLKIPAPTIQVNMPPITVPPSQVVITSQRETPPKTPRQMTTPELKDYGLKVVVEMEDIVESTEFSWNVNQRTIQQNPETAPILERRLDNVRHDIKEKWITGLGDRAEFLRVELAKRDIRDSFVDGWLHNILAIEEGPLTLKELAAHFREMLKRL